MDKAAQEYVLVCQIKQGDTNAFRQIFDQYRNVVFGYSYKLVKSQALAEEAVQEVFLKVWQHRHALNPSLSFSAFLYKITRNHVYNLLRKAVYDEQLKQQIFYHAQKSHHATENAVIYTELQSFAEKAIAHLPAQRQTIFRMSRFNGLSHDEIAQQLGISKNTVKDQIVKAVKFIKKYLQVHADITVTVFFLNILFTL